MTIPIAKITPCLPTGKPSRRECTKLELLFLHLRHWYPLRRWLINILAGECSVMVNVDWYGKVLMKGPWLVMRDSIAQDPTYEPPVFQHLRSSKNEILCKTSS